MLRVQSFFGLFALLFLAWVLSEGRGRFPARTVASGLLLQIILGLVFLYVPGSQQLFLALNTVVGALQQATNAGTSLVFGYLGGGALPFTESTPGRTFLLAFQALPLILVMSALSSLLFYLKVMPTIVRGISLFLQKTISIGGALGVGAAANIFVGMVEAPLFIRPYLAKMSRSEIFAIMTCGMATIAGTVMVLYATILQPHLPDAMGHILVASLISVPAALTIARVMVPEERSKKNTDGDVVAPETATSITDAITRGTTDGVQLLIQVTAMLIVFVALVHLANILLSLLPELAGQPVTLQRVLGVVMAPVVWLMGIPWPECMTAGALMGTKTIMNEFLAYLELAALPAEALSPRSRMIMIYALCGFANFGSLGIMIGGLGGMAPERRDEIVALGLRSIIAGTLATCMTGAVLGIFVG